MTNKEAIKILNGIRSDILPNDGVKRTEDVAFDLAIKALELASKPVFMAHTDGKIEVIRTRGKWECTKQGGIPITDRCTNCNYKMKWYTNKHKYCPNCGADMREEADYEN